MNAKLSVKPFQSTYDLQQLKKDYERIFLIQGNDSFYDLSNEDLHIVLNYYQQITGCVMTETDYNNCAGCNFKSLKNIMKKKYES